MYAVSRLFIPLCIAAVAAGQSPTQLVIKTGDAVPGNPSSTFGDVRPGAIDNANRVLLWANFEDTESVTGQGLFEWSEGTVTPIVVRGDAAPGVAGGTFRSFISTVAGTINDQGDVAFLAFVELAGREQTSVLRSVWLRSGEGLTLLALEGGILPGLAEGQELIGTPTGPVLNQQGVAVFRASIVDAEEPTAVVGAGIWRSDDGVISKVIRTGDDAPALPGETVLSLGGPLVTADGRAIFSGQASGSSFEVPNNTLWSSGLASTEVIAQSDDSAPGLFAASLGPIIFFEANGAGDVLLITEPNAVVTPVDRALFSIPRNGPRQLLIGENLIAPSLFGATVASIASGATTPSGGAFFSGVLQPGAAGVTNQNDRVLWQRAGDSTRVFLREGDPAPPSRDFEHDFPVAAIGNAAGDALFVTRLRDTDEQPSPTRSAIGVFDGERRRFGLLAVEGVRFDASLLQDRSDLRFLDRINTLLVSVDSGRPRYLSDQGVALYGLEFDDDSSGVFVSSITQPCSPADLSLPFGILNSSDINRFVSSFLAGSTRVDFAEPFGFINSSDINAFVSAFLAGCE